MTLLVPQLDDRDYGEIAYVEDGMIHMAGGLSYPQYSIEGIAIGEVLQAVANGEDAEAAALRVSTEIEEMFNDLSNNQDRGLYRNVTPRWDDGIVNYYWVSGIRSDYKKETKRAMDEWTAASNKKVKFVEITDNAWDWTLVVLGVKKIVRISEEKLEKDVAGRATKGAYIWGISTMKLDKSLDIVGQYVDDQTIYTTALHELGHVLGLEHEHQRNDRDTYIKVTKNDDDHKQYAESWLTVSSLAIEYRTKKVLFLTISYPVIVTRTTTYALFAKTAFDFNSIMIYYGLPIKPGYRNYANGTDTTGEWLTRYTYELSPLDKSFIKQIY